MNYTAIRQQLDAEKEIEFQAQRDEQFGAILEELEVMRL